MSVINHYVMLHSFLKYPGRFLSAEDMKEAVSLALVNQIKAVIVGNWLYCYTSDLIGVQLLSLGFWFSKKHEAYVYSGEQKKAIAPDDETLDEIKARLGSEELKGEGPKAPAPRRGVNVAEETGEAGRFRGQGKAPKGAGAQGGKVPDPRRGVNVAEETGKAPKGAEAQGKGGSYAKVYFHV